MSIIFVDIDEFKPINDRHGHLQGDQVLREMGKLLVQNLRDVDIICRYGGDEFVILLPETDKEGLTEKKALALMLAQPSMIKRPVLEAGGRLLVGFKPDVYAATFAK